jgi:hypothetical protein
MAQDVVITQNPECDVDAGSMVTCGANGSTAENWFARNIYIDQGVTINSVTWGSFYTTPISANIFFSIASGAGNPDGVTLTPVGTAVQPIDAGPWYDTPVDTPFDVPAGSYLVVEFQIPDTGVDQGIWPANTTTASETTYLKAADCGLTAYTDVVAIGFPDAQMIMCVNATVGNFDPCTLPLPTLCPADVDGDGVVAVSDVLVVIGTWGQVGDGTFRPEGDCAPLPNGDCVVDVGDVLAVVGAWGADCTVYGACCYGDGMCASTSMDDCSAGGGAWSEGSDCASIACIAAACCFSDNSCTDLTADSCTALGGDYKGDGTACTSYDCSAVTPGDECSNALMAIDGANPFDTTSMTASQPQPVDTMCSTSALAWDDSQDMWFVWTASVDDTYNIRTCENGYDTSMVIYEGSCTNQIACNGDFGDGTGNGGECTPWYSQIDLDATAGTTYYIRMGGWQAEYGTGTLNINVQPPPQDGACCFPDESCLDNLNSDDCVAFGAIFAGEGTSCADGDCLAGPGDECADAIVVLTGSTTFDTTNMTPSEPDPADTLCPGTFLSWSGSNDIWFEWVATGDVNASFSTCDSASYDTSMVLYEGGCDEANQVACNGDASGEEGCHTYYAAIYDYPVTAGTSYYIRIGGYLAANGPGTLTITDCDPLDLSACCLGSGVCQEMSANDCMTAGGISFCGTLCSEIDCYTDCPAKSVDEGAPCFVDGDDPSTDINAGPLVDPAVYGSLTAGTPLCGLVSVYQTDTDGDGELETYRDMDLYLLDGLDLGGQHTITVSTSGFNMNFGVLELNPAGAEPGLYGVAGAFYVIPGGIAGSVTFDLLPLTGEVYMIGVFPSEWNTSYSCGSGLNEYHIQVD